MSQAVRRESADERGRGAYQILFQLGRGGMGTVYLARALGAGGFERLVVIKRLNAHLLDQDDAVRRFMDEARIAGTRASRQRGRDAAGRRRRRRTLSGARLCGGRQPRGPARALGGPRRADSAPRSCCALPSTRLPDCTRCTRRRTQRDAPSTSCTVTCRCRTCSSDETVWHASRTSASPRALSAA